MIIENNPVVNDPSTWRIVGASYVLVDCDRCNGKGKLPFEDWQRPDGQWVRGGGFKPCPKCNGRKQFISWICGE